jgi:hypothetical protein
MRSYSLVLFASALAACTPFDPNLGGTSYKCGSAEPQCPGGYTCQMVGTDQRCVSNDGPAPDASPDAYTGFECAEDGFETLSGGPNNDTKETAAALNLPMFAVGPISICPEGDKDTFLLQVNANSNLEATTTWESGMAVHVAILNSGGTVINNGVVNGAASIKAFAANLPVGRYYVQTSAAPTVKNNYRLSVKVTQ